MANPLDIPTVAKVNPLNIPSGVTTAPAVKPVVSAPIVKPFANTVPGIAANTILGIPHAALGVAKDIGQGIARDTLGLGRTIQNVIAPGSAPQSEAPTGYLKTLLGEHPIETIPTQYHNTKTAIESSPIAQKIGASKFAAPLAFGATHGNNILDFAPIGGEDAATDVGTIASYLEKLGVHPDVAEKFAPHFAEATDHKEIKTLLDTVKGTQMIKHTAEARDALQSEPDLTYEPTAEESIAQAAKNHIPAPESGIDEAALHEYNQLPPEAVDEATANIPHHLEPLAEKARAAASPEEFKASIADLQDRYLKGEPLTMDDHVVLDSLKGARKDKIGTADEFYNRAVQKVDTKIPEELKPLAEEARKYKTADEFIQAKRGDYIPPDHFQAEEVARRKEVPSPLSEIDTDKIIDTGYKSMPVSERDALKIELKDTTKDNIKVYRTTKNGDLLPGDYVALTKSHAEQYLPRGGKVIEHSIPKDSLRFNERAGDFQYAPEGIHNLEDLHTQATKGNDKVVAPEAKGNIGIMDPTIEEQFARRAAGTPGATIEALAREPDAKSWQSLIKGFSRNMPRKEKVHFLDYFSTPEFVLEKLGLQKGAEMLQEAKDIYHANLKKEIERIISWREEVKNTPDSARRIFKYLDGEAKDVRHEMTDTEYRVAQDIKSYLKDWAKRLNLPEDNQISNYITHIFENGVVDLEGKESPFTDPDLAVIMDSSPAKSVYDPFLEKRTGKKGYRQDVWAALDAYVKRATRKEAMDPALERVAADAKKLEGDAYEYVTELTHRVNMRPMKIDKLFDNLITKFVGTKYTDRPTAYLTNKVRNMFYRGTIGLNLASALRNLSQGANTYAKLGEKYTAIGYTKIMSNLATNNLHELFREGILDDAIVQDRRLGVYKGVLQKLDPILYKMFDIAEKVNRGAAYYGAKSRGINKGLSEQEAIKYAKRIVRETQFSFSAVDTPVWLSGDVVKTAFQLQNYNAKQIEFFSRMIKNKEYGGLVRWTGASLAFVYTIGRAFGMTPIQLVPGIGIGGGSGSPTINFIDGLGKLGSSNSQTHDQGVKEIENTLVQTIPGGTQLKKTFQGVQAYAAGKDVTAAGNTRFKVPHDTQHLIQAALFGKSALPEAQQYYKKLNNSKSKKSAKNPLNV